MGNGLFISENPETIQLIYMTTDSPENEVQRRRRPREQLHRGAPRGAAGRAFDAPAGSGGDKGGNSWQKAGKTLENIGETGKRW